MLMRIRGVVYIMIALVLLVVFMAYSSDSFSLNGLLRPAPPAPPLLRIIPLNQKLNLENANADDEHVLNTLRDTYLIPPSKKEYNLTNPEIKNPSMGQAQRIDFILRGKKNGFYIECGALDGETRSNTLFFERFRDWKGLLIEADPSNYQDMIFKNRKAFLSRTCLAPSSHPQTVMFEQASNMGHIVGQLSNNPGDGGHGTILEVQCFPLYSYLLALNITTVDYFSLDVEGAEFSILKTLPFDKLDIKTLSVEYIHDVEGKEAIRSLMLSQGYILHSEVTHPKWLANDFIFVKKSLLNGPNGIFSDANIEENKIKEDKV